MTSSRCEPAHPQVLRLRIRFEVRLEVRLELDLVLNMQFSDAIHLFTFWLFCPNTCGHFNVLSNNSFLSFFPYIKQKVSQQMCN